MSSYPNPFSPFGLFPPPKVKRKAYFAFHFDDIMRVNNVRNVWKIDHPDAPTARSFQDSSLWESRKLQGDDVFLAQFLAKVAEVVRPAMEEMGQYLKSKGWAYEIIAQDEKTTYERDRNYPLHHIDASISLRMFPDGELRQPHYETPKLSVICDKSGKRVRFHESTMSTGKGGHSGPAGDCSLDQVSKGLIHDMIARVVQYVLK